MSAVYKAKDPNLRRPVAIKLIHAHLSSDPNFIGRFKEEAAAVARLRHPNIVQVHDFNTDGETYYMVMEFLVGETLQKRLKRLNATGRRMSLQDAVGICIQVCEAAGYAHKHELVHRDIKPANIMLDVHGQAILMDFGIVKIIGGDYHTATGATLGTAMYMSPEQIRAERIDERADIYSLGVTLYEMLSGQPPYTADSALTLMMMVLNDPLPDLGETRPGMPEKLLTVVEKALAKQPSERYQTMKMMATDLRQVLEELENTPPAAEATVVDETESTPEGKPMVVDEAAEDNTQAAPARVPLPEKSFTVEPHKPTEERLITAKQHVDKIEQSPVQSTNGKIRLGIARISHRGLFIAAAGLVLVAAIVIGVVYLNARKLPNVQLAVINSSPEPMTAQNAAAAVSLGRWEIDSYIERVVYSPEGSFLGTANNREQARFSPYRYYSGIWQVANGSLQRYISEHTQWVYDVAFSPSGDLFAAVSDDGSMMLWETANGNLVRTIESEHGGLTGMDFSPSGMLVAAGSWDGVVGLWQIDNGVLLRTMQVDDYSIQDVVFSSDGSLLAAATDNNTILVWSVSEGRLAYTLQGHTAPVRAVAFSPDGTLLASGSDDHSILLWQVGEDNPLRSLAGHSEAVNGLAFSPDGSVLASASSDGFLRLWEVSDGALLSTLVEHDDSILSVDFSPDGHTLVSGAGDGVVQFWGISEAIPTISE
jgi:serine/threonine protein kinase